MCYGAVVNGHSIVLSHVRLKPISSSAFKPILQIGLNNFQSSPNSFLMFIFFLFVFFPYTTTSALPDSHFSNLGILSPNSPSGKTDTSSLSGLQDNPYNSGQRSKFLYPVSSQELNTSYKEEDSESTAGAITTTPSPSPQVTDKSSSIVGTENLGKAVSGGLHGASSSTDDDLYWDMEGNDKEYFSGEQFEYEQELRRKRAFEKKWIAEGLANQAGSNGTTTVWVGSQVHPTKGNRHTFLWRYQFGPIILALVAMYILQVLIDFKYRKSFSLHCRPSTCLMLGANFRGLGETKLVSCARFITSSLLHAHIFHLFSNTLSIFAAWMYFSLGPGMKQENIWVYHWTFPVFLSTAFCGSFYSYHTTLKYSGFSIGASGGCLGLTSAFLALAVRIEGVPANRRFHLIFTVLSILGSCIPWDSIFSGEAGSSDLGAHGAGALSGLIIAVFLSLVPKAKVEQLIDLGDICSCILLVLLILAFAEVAREHIVDGRELLVRAYVKWLGMTSTIPEDGRRSTAPGRLRCELITEEYLYLLDAEKIEDDPESVIKRLEEENEHRHKSVPNLGGIIY